MTSNFNDDLASVVSSEADATIGGDDPNVEELDSENEGDTQPSITAVHILNWQGCWSTWANYHRISILPFSEFASLITGAPSHPIAQVILNVFSYAWSIPSERFTTSQEPIPPPLDRFLSEIVSLSPTFITTSSTPIPPGSAPTQVLVSHAFQAQQLASLLVSQPGPSSNDTWEREIYRPLLMGCVGACFEQPRDWEIPSSPITTPIPNTSQTIQTLPIHPWGSIRTVAALCTSSQVTSAQCDTPESDALYAFGIMACMAALGRTAAGGGGPVFGILFDRHTNSTHLSLPLPPSPAPANLSSPFLSLNLTSPSDTLRLAFILDAIATYAHPTASSLTTSQADLSEAQSYIPSSTQIQPPSAFTPPTKPREKAPGEEMSSREKVMAWMMGGGTGDFEAITWTGVNGFADIDNPSFTWVSSVISASYYLDYG
ncbi:hypothetical protein BU17DRAFT_71631 [Hysterangium stoloniferum]|nr:hypothetical protein BU17DRAFT_71631 [Hysterangium stoloniferum]